MDQDFLLDTETAKMLYHNYAAKMPVLDYHCHISPQEIAEDRQFKNITQVWLGGDHYKWRQMRSNGIEERYITGDASDREKFQKWAETLERAIGNPLYHWSHLELQRYFGYHGALNAKTAEEVWNLCNEKLQSPQMSARNLIRQSNVTLICTTDDPADDLRWHKQLKEDDSFEVQVLPAWRPDLAMKIEKPGFAAYMKKLGESADMEIRSFAEMKQALTKRMEFFDEMGCRASDHGLDYAMYVPASEEEIEAIFAKGMAGEPISKEEELKYKTAFMLYAGREYNRLGWAMQLHYGCKRDNNVKRFQKLGPDTGFDCIDTYTPSAQLADLLNALNWAMQLHYGCKRDNNVKRFQKLGPDTGFDCIDTYTPSAQLADLLNALNMTDELPKTILYSLNPNDNAAIGTIIGCFQDAGVAGKIQQGSAWWFNDHKQGMIDQMTSLANLGLLGNFVGMLTDSRSFLSYTRHEYFRRILCNLIGGWVENGEYPADEEILGRIVEDISYNNAVKYFGFDL